MRQVITITAPPEGLPAGHPIGVTFDHAKQVAEGRSLPNGDDVFVVARLADGTLAPIDRVADEAFTWNRSDTKIWFATIEGVTPEYWLYWGADAPATLPPADPERVFSFFDRFDGSELDLNRWSVVRLSGVVQNGQLILGPEAAVSSANLRAYGVDTIWETRVTLSTMGLFTGTLDIFTAGQLLEGVGIGFYGTTEGLAVRSSQGSELVPLADPFVPHVLGFVRRAAEVVFLLDGQALFTLPDPLFAAQDLYVLMTNSDASATVMYDWVRVRRYLPEEPQVALGAIEANANFLPSRFGHRKLMAFRTDVFARALHVSAPDLASTRAVEPVPIAVLDADALEAEADELLIAAARVSGESSATGRKSGAVRANGAVLLQTSHRIDRDSSRENGYHHVVGVVDGQRASAAARYQIDIASPDAIQVDGVGATIVVLSYPSRR